MSVTDSRHGLEVEPRLRGDDLRLLPLALACWVGSWIGTFGSITATTTGLGTGLVLAAIAVRRRSSWLIASCVVLMLTTAIGSLYAYRLSAGPLGRLVTAEATVVAEVVSRGDPHLRPAVGVRPDFVTVPATLAGVSGRGGQWRTRLPILVTVSGQQTQIWRSAPVGTRWLVHCRLQPAMSRSGLAAVLRATSSIPPTLIAEPGPALRGVERVRQGLRDAVANRAPGPRALVPALVLGDTSELTPDQRADFNTSGLTHLTAVSGANLTLLLAFLLTVARWAGIRGWSLRAVGLAGVVVFIGLCRSEPSVLRAAAMGLVALAALGSGGRRAGLRNLFLAALVLLLIDPFLSRSIGFGLSVLASAGILIWAPRWTGQLQRWVPRLVAESLAVPLAAHLATLPVVAAISGSVSVVGVIANALAGPLVGPATVLGFIAAGLSVFSDTLAAIAGFGAAWPAQLIIWIGSTAAQLPGASLQWPGSPVGLTILGAMSLTAALAMRQILGRPSLAIGLALAMIGALLVAPSQPGWPPRGWVLVPQAVDTVGDASWVVLGPSSSRPPILDSESEQQDDSSLVLAIQVAGIRLLLTGDVEPPGQQAILSNGADLRADVLKVPHHGSARQEPAFFAATHAKVAITSAGLHNDYGHPAPRTVALVRSLGMILLRTDTQGSVAITVRDGSLGAVAQRRS